MEEQIIIDAQGTCTPFPHFWEHMFGSCHASVTLCEDWRNDLRALREIVDVRYIRFHGIFEHQVGIYGGQDPAGNLLLNFTRVDLIYDGSSLLGEAVAPYEIVTVAHFTRFPVDTDGSGSYRALLSPLL